MFAKFEQRKPYKKITVDDLRFVLENDEPPIIIDVCEEWEYYRRHIDGAINIPLSSMDAEVDEILDSYDTEQDFVVYCSSGIRSKTAATILKKHGYKNVYSLIGGSAAYFRTLHEQA